MDRKSLFEMVNEVKDEDSFLLFIKALSKDRVDFVNKKVNDEWQNETIEKFLEVAHEWGEISKSGLEFYDKPDNAWKRCAQILYMGKIYE